MARRKKVFQPTGFENVGKSKLSATIYASMMNSYPWMQLTPQAKVLYLYMKLQMYGQKPLEDYPADTFVFNFGMYVKTYHLYSNWKQFDRDCKQLVKWGFIKVYENGHTTRTKNIYQFSGEWQNINTQYERTINPISDGI